MFTGLIEEIGSIENIQNKGTSLLLKINANKVLENTKIGDSLCTNGVCLTVTSLTENYFTANVMAASIESTNFAELKAGSKVNLERALTLNTRLGGHLLSGHVDGIGKIIKIETTGIATLISIESPSNLLKYMILKGSIAVEGISLTIQNLNNNTFQISLIPHSLKQTNLQFKKHADTVNLEVDMIAKYTESILRSENNNMHRQNKTLDMNYLAENGFV